MSLSFILGKSDCRFEFRRKTTRLRAGFSLNVVNENRVKLIPIQVEYYAGAKANETRRWKRTG